MAASEIPKFNRGRKAFEPPQVQENIRLMLNAADFVTVTTDHLRRFYHEKYGVPLENIVAIPNLLPRYLFGDRYRPQTKLDQFKANKAKPRIGIVSSLSHYNIDDVRLSVEGLACRKQKNQAGKIIVGQDGKPVWKDEKDRIVDEAGLTPIVDDIDEILDCIRSTVDDFRWVFFGYCPPKLEDLAKSGKIEVRAGTPIYNYASAFDNLGLQAVVAPIAKIEFNYCKSFIKYMECAALGVPCFATRCLPYDRMMPDSQLYTDGNELKDKLMKLKFASAGAYQKAIERQWEWLNAEQDEGDFHLKKGFWLEDNLNLWTDRFRLRRKGAGVSFMKFRKQYSERKAKEKADTLFTDGVVSVMK